MWTGTLLRRLLPSALVALVALVPFLRGLASGASFYFRDLSLYFLPVRRFALEGLAAGEVRFWNPYVHEGVPLSLPAVGYPLDLLQLLRPDEAGLSAVLALHVPLAALFFFSLVRGLSLGRVAAVGGALVYALGGFVLSSLNLYVYLQAAAWAPLLALALARVPGGGGRRAVAAAALVRRRPLDDRGRGRGPGVVIGLALGAPGRGGRSSGHAALALGLAVAMAAPVLLLVAGQLAGSARGRVPDRGRARAVGSSFYARPDRRGRALRQPVATSPGEWWGQNFFPRGFPYVLSLYSGRAALALAGGGASRLGGRRRPSAGRARRPRSRGGVGRWSGIERAVDARARRCASFRFPVKAFFTVHFAVSLAGASGLSLLVGAGDRRPWRRLVRRRGGAGRFSSSSGRPAAPPPSRVLRRLRPRVLRSGLTPTPGLALLGRVLTDAAVGGGRRARPRRGRLFWPSAGRSPPPRARAWWWPSSPPTCCAPARASTPWSPPSFFRPSPAL